MNIEEFAEQFGEVKAKVEYHDQQIETLIQTQETLHKLVTSVELLAQNQGTMTKQLSRVETKVENMEAIPAKRWQAVVEKALLLVVGALVTFVLAKLGLV